MGGEWGDAQGPDGVTPPGGATDHRDDGEKWGRRRVGVYRGRVGDGLRGDPPHRSIYTEAAYDHIREGGLQACLYIVNGGIEDAGYKPDDALVG